MERNLPATQTDPPPAEPTTDPADRLLATRQPLSVAFLPLALITFIVLAFTIAAWTFLSATL